MPSALKIMIVTGNR